LKSSCLLLRSFEIDSEYKSFDIKIKGNDTIASYGEAVFYHSNMFDLSDKMAMIIDADAINVELRNLGNASTKEANILKINLTFNYSKLNDGNIIFNNVYTNLNPEGLNTILSDISNAGKHVTKIIWTSSQKLTSLEFKPQFETDPEWLKPVREITDSQNHIIMNLTDDVKYDPDFVNQLSYYTLCVPPDLEKLGVIVYGYLK
jgi:hypothetical protein